jgi:hypothetical protein
MAQKVEPRNPVFPQGDLTVLSIVGGTATLTSNETSHSFMVDAPKDLVKEWEYFFVLQTTDDSKDLRTRPAIIKFYAITPKQAAKNITTALRDFKAANPQR